MRPTLPLVTLVALLISPLLGCEPLGFDSDPEPEPDAQLPEAPCGPGDSVRCADDGELVYCRRGRISSSRRCPDDQICVSPRYNSAGCALTPLEPCERDGCAADGSALLRCNSPAGHVYRVIECDAGAHCVDDGITAACVAAPSEPCDGPTYRCTADGREVLQRPCHSGLGLAEPERTERRCLAVEQCIARDGTADCALEPEVPCSVDDELIGESSIIAIGEAPTGCVGDVLTRCGRVGAATAITTCDGGCQTQVEPVPGDGPRTLAAGCMP